MSVPQPSNAPNNRPSRGLLLLYGIALCGLYPVIITLLPPSATSGFGGLLQINAMATSPVYFPNGNPDDPDAAMSNGSPALNQAYNNAKRLGQLADTAEKPASQAALRELSTGLYQLSVAQAGYEYLNGNEALGHLIHATKDNPVPDSPAKAVKNVKTWRDRILKSLHKLDAQAELPAKLKAIAQGMAMDVVRRTNQQYGSLLN